MNSHLVEYYEQCKSGAIVIGRELMQMLEILMDDFKVYHFDPTEAHKRIAFIERECKHSISPFAGEPFILELWQKALMESVYGFYMEIEGKLLRRFTELLLVIGRKNGKSSWCSALALAEFFCGNRGTNIMCASNDFEQAGILFDEINNMREESTRLEKVSRKNIKGIFMGNPKQRVKKGKFSYQNKAKIKKLSSRTGGKEGRNLDVAIVDESHEMKDSSLIMPLRQSMSTKDEALLIEITTEGFTADGHLDKQMVEARRILKGELHRPRKLVWLYTQDSEEEVWQDRNTWPKSNPNLGVSKKWHYLDEIVEEAKSNSGTRAFMLAKDFNIKQSSALAWLRPDEIMNSESFDLREFAGGFFISGNDFAETIDLCASQILLKKPNDRRVYLHSHYWIPESKLKASPDGADYIGWQKAGHLTIVPGNAVESSMVADWHYELFKEYDLKPFKSGYDNRFAKDFVRRYDEIFGEKIAINVPQDTKVLNNPMRTMEADMKEHLVVYNSNPVDIWCYKNTGVKVDTLGRMMPAKMHETQRIDGAAAAIIAYAVLEWFRSEFASLHG